ncbi:MAG: TetR family transcriptional regulator [Lapillicoccus sp.]
MTETFVRARRPEHKQQRRDAILAAARDLALERGVRAVTLGDLAVSVGLAKSNVVRYFGTREEIFVELCSQEGLRLRDALGPRLADVTQETLPGVLAGTLMEHELFCELLSQLTTHLEHHVSFAAAERLKVTSTAIIAGLARDLARRPVGLDVERAALLLSTTSQIGAGLWSASRPSEVVVEVYAAHPEIVPTGAAHAVLERLVAALAAGLRAEVPASTDRAQRHTVKA